MGHCAKRLAAFGGSVEKANLDNDYSALIIYQGGSFIGGRSNLGKVGDLSPARNFGKKGQLPYRQREIRSGIRSSPNS